MVPQEQKHRHTDRYEYGHDTEGTMYRLTIRNKDRKELKREKLNGRIIWTGQTADFGIKKFKRASRKQKNAHWLNESYKKNAWNNSSMKETIAKSALKKPKKKT